MNDVTCDAGKFENRSLMRRFGGIKPKVLKEDLLPVLRFRNYRFPDDREMASGSVATVTGNQQQDGQTINISLTFSSDDSNSYQPQKPQISTTALGHNVRAAPRLTNDDSLNELRRLKREQAQKELLQRLREERRQQEDTGDGVKESRSPYVTHHMADKRNGRQHCRSAKVSRGSAEFESDGRRPKREERLKKDSDDQLYSGADRQQNNSGFQKYNDNGHSKQRRSASADPLDVHQHRQHKSTASPVHSAGRQHHGHMKVTDNDEEICQFAKAHLHLRAYHN
jgi:hypothetical protein